LLSENSAQEKHAKHASQALLPQLSLLLLQQAAEQQFPARPAVGVSGV
jgi:hypothetical protein